MGLMGEFALIFGVCLAGEAAAALLPVRFPASVISMVLLTALLLLGPVKEKQIQNMSRFLVANMGIFFVPSLVGTLEYLDVLKVQILPFLAVTLVTTPVVYLITGLSVQALMRIWKKKEEQNHV